MARTKIEWTHGEGYIGETWNPVTGCTQVSPGCAHCYAKTLAEGRFAHQYPEGFGKVTLHPERLAAPLSWRKPRMVFANSMSDLFHEDVPFQFIDRVFAVMAIAHQHRFQVLTKRPDRMLQYFCDYGEIGKPTYLRVAEAELEWPKDLIATLRHVLTLDEIESGDFVGRWPLPNVWLGVSVENQHWADIRIPLLLQTPAAVRFVSYEPALKAVDFRHWLLPQVDADPYFCADCGGFIEPHGGHDCYDAHPAINQIIIGGESGPRARPFDPEWARQTLAQCRAAGVAVFVKQMGSVWAKEKCLSGKGGDMAEWPADLRVREYPNGVVER